MFEQLKKVKRKIADGQPVLGTLVTSTDSAISEMMGFSGFDYIWLDAEHFPLTAHDIRMHAIAAHSGDIALFVRVRENDPMLVKPLLDLGVDGIIFPMIKTAEDAELAVAGCVYPPKGIRGFGPSRCIRYYADPVADYVEDVNNRVLKILQVEHVDCVRNLEQIAQVEGIDTFMIGPSDLSSSAGLLNQVFHPEIQKLIGEISRISHKYGIPLGAFTGDQPETIRMWLSHGVQLMCIGADTGYMRSAAVASLKSVGQLAVRQEGK